MLNKTHDVRSANAKYIHSFTKCIVSCSLSLSQNSVAFASVGGKYQQSNRKSKGHKKVNKSNLKIKILERRIEKQMALKSKTDDSLRNRKTGRASLLKLIRGRDITPLLPVLSTPGFPFFEYYNRCCLHHIMLSKYI